MEDIIVLFILAFILFILTLANNVVVGSMVPKKKSNKVLELLNKWLDTVEFYYRNNRDNVLIVLATILITILVLI